MAIVLQSFDRLQLADLIHLFNLLSCLNVLVNHLSEFVSLEVVVLP